MQRWLVRVSHVSIFHKPGLPIKPGDCVRMPCLSTASCTEAALYRDEAAQITYYEVVYPAEALGQDAFVSGWSFGLSY